jgi:hypothetical protein
MRLAIGVALDLVVLLCSANLARSGGEGDFAVTNIAAAAGAVVVLIPIFWRGEPWQAAASIAFLLLPVMVLWAVVDTIIHK